MSLVTGRESEKDGERRRLTPAGGMQSTGDYGNGVGNGFDEESGRRSRRIAAEEDTDELTKAMVFGALDGMLTSFAIVAGAAGGKLGTQAILILGVSSMVADGLSMGLGEYLSSKALNRYIDVERKREEWEVTHNRQAEIDAMVALYTSRGVSHQDAKEVLDRLAKYDHFFVNALVSEQLGMTSYSSPYNEENSLREGAITFAAFAVSGVIPLLVYLLSPFLHFDGHPPSQGILFLMACAVTAVGLFAVGVLKAAFVSRSWYGAGLETLVLGGCCAGFAYEMATMMASCVGKFGET